MIISYLWLKEWVDHNLSPEELADGLTSLGLETNIVADGRGKFANFIGGEVESVKPHPNADKLRLTSVSVGGGCMTGDDSLLPIVCGAPNVAAGQTVGVAMVGATLPDGTLIEKREIRSELSEGMILSERELGISDEHEGILVLEPPATAGQKLSECLELEDTLLEIDLTPNRGDCLSLIGVAREVSALTGATIKIPEAAKPGKIGIDNFKVAIADSDACPRYTARQIVGVKVADSPVKMRRRLSAVGIRPINNVVDVTNYVMIETGHPLHSFDGRTLEGAQINVRCANSNEKFKTLDDREHTLTDEMPVIADVKKPVALAGVMGGLNSEIHDDTSEIILEAAYFSPVSVRRTAKKLGISTESSYRFERGVNCESVDFASHRAAKLMVDIAGGELKGFADEYPAKPDYPQVTLRTQKVNDILGLELTGGEIDSILRRLGFEFERLEESFRVVCPPHRHDIKLEIDLVEEVARLVGYRNIPTRVARLAQHEAAQDTGYRKRRDLNRLWAAASLNETVNYSFINSAWRERLQPDESGIIKLQNPISAEWSELRGSLLPGLIQTTGANLRQGAEEVSIFETGVVFRSDGKNGVTEEFMSAGLITGGMENIFNLKMPRDFYRLKGIVDKVLKSFTGMEPAIARPSGRRPFLYPHRQAEIYVGGKMVGFVGQLHPLVTEPFEIDLDLLCFEISVDRLLQSGSGRAKAGVLPKFPGIKRDMALIVDEKEEAGGIVKTIIETDEKHIRSCRLFDLYRGKQVPEGKKSLAFSLFIMDDEKTLTDETGDRIFATVLERVEKKHNARLR
ncbi:MAG: phenylalanine--tRNA ligase subunit beta [Nitrospinota bacterium]